ncbi:hypothetical protein [Bernardetia sp. MNP-M8]|uniref:hypothetical protein n=1 Tax=Bernardetia sp. MNP-M8 TaxID=3127470 RepID=UPI0030CC00EC
MKIFYIIFIFIIISCHSLHQENNKAISCEEKVNNFTLDYTRRKKLDTISSYKEDYLYKNIHVFDIQVYMEGRTTFNLMCWNDSIYFNDNIFSNQIYVYKKSLDISDQIIGMSSLI